MSDKYENTNVTIYNSDCMDALPLIADESVDFIITDMPYESTKSFITRNDAKDLNSDFGYWDVFFLDWLPHAHRVLKKNSGMVVFVPITRYETFMNAATKEGFRHVQPWRWHKMNPVPTVRGVLQWSTEDMGYYVKGVRVLNIENHGLCHDLFEYPIPMGEVRFHPTQKPLELLEHIVKMVSSEGDTILDCFHGSGTTGLAALNLRRKYIGIERDVEYFNKSVERINRIYKDNIFGAGIKKTDSKNILNQIFGDKK